MSKYRQLVEHGKTAIKIGILSLALPNPLLGGDFYNQYNSGIMGNKATVKQQTTPEKKSEQKPEVVKDKPQDKKPSPPISKVDDKKLVGKSQEIITGTQTIGASTNGTSTTSNIQEYTLSREDFDKTVKETDKLIKQGIVTPLDLSFLKDKSDPRYNHCRDFFKSRDWRWIWVKGESAFYEPGYEEGGFAFRHDGGGKIVIDKMHDIDLQIFLVKRPDDKQSVICALYTGTTTSRFKELNSRVEFFFIDENGEGPGRSFYTGLPKEFIKENIGQITIETGYDPIGMGGYYIQVGVANRTNNRMTAGSLVWKKDISDSKVCSSPIYVIPPGMSQQEGTTISKLGK